MFLVFLIYLELCLWSSACVDLLGRLVSAVSVCLFVSVWTSVCTKVPLLSDDVVAQKGLRDGLRVT